MLEMPEKAARALAVVRREGRDLRFEVAEICDARRYRLSVRYRAQGGEEVRLGLVYSTDRGALDALLATLAAAG